MKPWLVNVMLVKDGKPVSVFVVFGEAETAEKAVANTQALFDLFPHFEDGSLLFANEASPGAWT